MDRHNSAEEKPFPLWGSVHKQETSLPIIAEQISSVLHYSNELDFMFWGQRSWGTILFYRPCKRYRDQTSGLPGEVKLAGAIQHCSLGFRRMCLVLFTTCWICPEKPGNRQFVLCGWEILHSCGLLTWKTIRLWGRPLVPSNQMVNFYGSQFWGYPKSGNSAMPWSQSFRCWKMQNTGEFLIWTSAGDTVKRWALSCFPCFLKSWDDCKGWPLLPVMQIAVITIYHWDHYGAMPTRIRMISHRLKSFRSYQMGKTEVRLFSHKLRRL